MLKLTAEQAQRKLRTYATAMRSCSPTQCKISTTRWTLRLICVSGFQCSVVGQFSKLNYRVETTTIGVFNSPFQWIGCNPLALIRPSFRPKTTKSAQKISWKSRLSPLKTEKSHKSRKFLQHPRTISFYAIFVCLLGYTTNPSCAVYDGHIIATKSRWKPGCTRYSKSKWRYDRNCCA